MAPNQLNPTLHGHAIFGVVSVSDTGTSTTRRIPVSGECPLFFFSFLRHAPTQRQHGSDTAPTRLRIFRHASNEEKKKISTYFGSFRPISAEMKISSDTRFWLKKNKKKSKSKSYLLLLGFVLFFLLIFFLISVSSSSSSSSSSSFGFGLLPDYLFFFICVLAVLHLCLEFRL